MDLVFSLGFLDSWSEMSAEKEISSKSTRNRILDAALDVFSNNGYHTSRMDDIVDEASVSKGSIYFHFPNKERLFLALVDQFSDLIDRSVTEAIAEEEGIQKVAVAVETVLATFAKYRRPTKILLVQAVGLGSVFEKKRQEVHDRFASMIEDFLNEAVKAGDIQDVNTKITAHAWMGAIYTLVMQWVMTSEPSKEDIKEHLLPLLLRSVGYEVEA